MSDKYGSLCSALNLLTGWLLVGLAQGEMWQVRDDGGLGYVEIFYRSKWRPLITKDLDVEDQKVICRNLGFSKPTTMDVYYFPYKHTPGQTSPATVLLSCRGNETTIGQCPVLNVTLGMRENCQTIYLTCTMSWGLRKGPRGYVELFNENVWRPLVTKDLTMREERVVCRNLKYTYIKYVRADYVNYTWGVGEPQPASLRLRCRGNEPKIDTCPLYNVTIGVRGAGDQIIYIDCVTDSVNEESNDTTYIVIGVVAAIVFLFLILVKVTNGEALGWVFMCCCWFCTD